jgi:hypothetical protein
VSGGAKYKVWQRRDGNWIAEINDGGAPKASDAFMTYGAARAWARRELLKQSTPAPACSTCSDADGDILLTESQHGGVPAEYGPCPDCKAPRRRFNKFICPWCGDFVDATDVVRVRFELRDGTEVGRLVCKNCQSTQPCPADVTGIHGEVCDGDYEGARPSLPFEPDHQHGWCSRCDLPMMWSVERQRWVDYPEELTPTGRLARLMDAHDHGQLSDEDYEAAVAEVLSAV